MKTKKTIDKLIIDLKVGSRKIITDAIFISEDEFTLTVWDVRENKENTVRKSDIIIREQRWKTEKEMTEKENNCPD